MSKKIAPIKWPADNPVRRAVQALIPYARNSRTHSDEQVTQIAASIKEWGFTNPILIDGQGGIIAGHGRLLAAKKPIEIAERPIRHATEPGDIVLDLFGGSGSTLIAAEKNGRACRMMELDPKYVDVIVKRWEAFTGKQATHAVTGKTFAEVANGDAIARAG